MQGLATPIVKHKFSLLLLSMGLPVPCKDLCLPLEVMTGMQTYRSNTAIYLHLCIRCIKP